MTLDADLDVHKRKALPDALRILLDKFPREGWKAHPNFHDHLTFWLDRHLMFRRLVDMLTQDAQSVVAKSMDPVTHATRLSRLGSHLINDLHGHHTIEDQYFFPQLVRLDNRIAWGFGLLEADHAAIDPALADFALAANAVLDGGEAGPLIDQLDLIARLLDRHLTDEEEIIVPVALSTGFRF